MEKALGYALFTFVLLVVHLLCLCIHHQPRRLRNASGELCAFRCATASATAAAVVAAVVYAIGERLRRCGEAEAEMSAR